MAEKSNLELKVKVKGDPEPKVTWQLEGKELGASPKIQFAKKNDVHTLTIQQIGAKQAGLYRCVAANTVGQADHSATLTLSGTCCRFSSIAFHMYDSILLYKMFPCLS